MKLVSLAVSGSFLVMLLAVPSRAQVGSDHPAIARTVPQRSWRGPLRTGPLVAGRVAAHADAATGLDGGRIARKSSTSSRPSKWATSIWRASNTSRRRRPSRRCPTKIPPTPCISTSSDIALHQQEALTLAMQYYEKALKANPATPTHRTTSARSGISARNSAKPSRPTKKPSRSTTTWPCSTAISATPISATRSMKSRSRRSASRCKRIRNSSSTTPRAPARCSRIAL